VAAGAMEEEVHMTPEEALERLAAGGYVLCNDVPPTTEFGCDIITWNGASWCSSGS
jgi:hypothetical protein